MRPPIRALAAGLLLGSSLALAQGYPSKPVRLLLPFAGGTDAVARLLALKLSPALGEQVLPEQRLGAGGNIAHRALAAAAPDGYTLLMAAPPLVINPHLNPNAGFDPLRDFAAVAYLTAIANVLVVHTKVPARSLDELIGQGRDAGSGARQYIERAPVPTGRRAGITGTRDEGEEQGPRRDVRQCSSCRRSTHSLAHRVPPCGPSAGVASRVPAGSAVCSVCT